MSEYTRKIQLIGGSTFTVSLPKQWVSQVGIQPKSEVLLYVQEDGSLLLNPKNSDSPALSSVDLSMSAFGNGIEHALYVLYYLGVKTITIQSKEFSTAQKQLIRDCILDMSGTEIVYEDKERLEIRVLLEKSKINLQQVLYRIFLLIDSSLHVLVENFSYSEIRSNEGEVDRLYHLATKLIVSSLRDVALLQSSGITKTSLIPSLFLLSKRLENISDNVETIGKHCDGNKSLLELAKPAIVRMRSYMQKLSLGLLNEKKLLVIEKELDEIEVLCTEVSDVWMHSMLKETVRYIDNLHAELLMIKYYNEFL